MNEEYFNISGLLRLYIKNWRIYLPVGIVSLLFAVLFIIIYPPQYEINARIQLKEDTGGFSAGFQQFTSKGVIGGLLGAGLNAINVNNESLIISSRRNLKNAIRESKYQIEVRQRQGLCNALLYNEQLPFRVLVPTSVLDTLSCPVKISLECSRGEILKLKASSSLFPTRRFKALKIPAVVELPFFSIGFQEVPGKVADGTYTIRISPLQKTFEILHKKIFVGAEESATNIVLLSYDDESRERGCNLLNAMMSGFNSLTLDNIQAEATRMRTFISSQLDSVSRELIQLETDIEQFQQQHKIPEPQLYAKASVEGNMEIEQLVLQAEADLRFAQSVADYFHKPENRYATLPAVVGIDSEVLLCYNEMILTRQRLAKEAGTKNPAFLLADSQLENQRVLMQNALDTGIKSLKSRLSTLKSKESNLSDKLKQMPSDVRTYMELKRRQKISESLYLFLMEQYQEKILTGTPEEESGRVLDEAYSSYKPVFPRKSIVLVVAVILAFMISFIIVCCRKL